jgi:hypothetical protein
MTIVPVLVLTLFVTIFTDASSPADTSSVRKRKNKIYSTSLIATKPSKHRQIPYFNEHRDCLDETVSVIDNLPQKYFTNDILKQYCTGFPDGPEFNCDFAGFESYSNFDCSEAGGKLVSINMEICNSSLYISNNIDGDSASYYVIDYNKMLIGNFNQCAGVSCSRDDIENIIDADNTIFGVDCPTESKYHKFAYRVKTGETITKNCNWLSKSSEKIISRACRKKKFQIYTDEYLPASQVCPMTCQDFCPEEHPTAKFIAGVKIDGDSGKEIPMIRSCKWLATKTNKQRRRLCLPLESNARYLKTDYDYGWKVCTSTCPSTCQKNKK